MWQVLHGLSASVPPHCAGCAGLSWHDTFTHPGAELPLRGVYVMEAYVAENTTSARPFKWFAAFAIVPAAFTVPEWQFTHEVPSPTCAVWLFARSEFAPPFA